MYGMEDLVNRKPGSHSIWYMYKDNKLLAPVACFAELVEIGLWAEQHAPYTQFLPRPAGKESSVPKLKHTA